MNRPLLDEDPTAAVVVDAAGVGMPARYLPLFHFQIWHAPQPRTGGLEPLVKQAVRIDRGDSGIAIPMERDERDDLSEWSCVLACPLLHRRQGGGQIMGGPI